MILHGDCLDLLPTIERESIDAVVTDPPYGLTSGKKGGTGVASVDLDSPYGRARIGTGNGAGGFMGKQWDGTGIERDPALWRAIFDTMKPGAHLVACGGTRTFHRMAVAIEDAGFEIRDCLMWLYGSGFPKSLDVGKAIDKARRRDYVQAAIDLGLDVPGNSLHDWTKAEHSPGDAWWERFKAHLSIDDWRRIERDVIGRNERPKGWFTAQDGHDITAPATPEAQQWDGWGTALKPAYEPIILARKPIRGTVAANVLTHGTGALNIDANRVTASAGDIAERASRNGQTDRNTTGYMEGWTKRDVPRTNIESGRWPPNALLDPDAAAMLDAMSGESRSTGGQASLGAFRNGDVYGKGKDIREKRDPGYGDTGGASRFFPVLPVDDPDTLRFLYAAKASRAERNAGLDGMPERDNRPLGLSNWKGQTNGSGETMGPSSPQSNSHPCVKPLALMRWLVRLVTPPGGIVLDPFMGSGTTGIAAHLEGMQFIGIEREAEYVEIATKRIAHYGRQSVLPLDIAAG